MKFERSKKKFINKIFTRIFKSFWSKIAHINKRFNCRNQSKERPFFSFNKAITIQLVRSLFGYKFRWQSILKSIFYFVRRNWRKVDTIILKFGRSWNRLKKLMKTYCFRSQAINHQIADSVRPKQSIQTSCKNIHELWRLQAKTFVYNFVEDLKEIMN